MCARGSDIRPLLILLTNFLFQIHLRSDFVALDIHLPTSSSPLAKSTLSFIFPLGRRRTVSTERLVDGCEVAWNSFITNMANVDIHPSPVLPYDKEIRENRRYEDEALTDGRMPAGKYAATRITTLKPPMDRVPNPFKLLAMLNTQQWLFFLVAFFAWSWDAFDFFTVSLTVTDLAETFNKSNTDITWGITLVLMFRSLGSTIFGIAADRYGRKWYAIRHYERWSSLTVELGPSSSTTSCSLFSSLVPALPRPTANS